MKTKKVIFESDALMLLIALIKAQLEIANMAIDKDDVAAGRYFIDFCLKDIGDICGLAVSELDADVLEIIKQRNRRNR